MADIFGGSEDEEESIRARSREVREGPGVFLERISGGDQEEVTPRASDRGVGVDGKKETEWR